MSTAPLPNRPGDASPGRVPWVTTARRVGRRTCATLVAVLASYLGGCVLALAVYGAVFPPITGVQLQRAVGALGADVPDERAYTPVPLDRIDRSLARAVVAAEDSRFFRHHGIDWAAVRKAIREYRKGKELRGASSITQQLVKNLFMTTHSTVLRKALEVPLTYAAEAILTKRRILELYLNVIEWGPGVYGAEAAAQHHYGVSARHLSRWRAAALAACIPNPRVRRPATVGWYTRIILRRMHNLAPLPLSSGPRPVPRTGVLHAEDRSAGHRPGGLLRLRRAPDRSASTVPSSP